MFNKISGHCVIFLDARSGAHIANVAADTRSHWFDKNLFGSNRVIFDSSPSPDKAKLKIFNVSESDDGIYRQKSNKFILTLPTTLTNKQSQYILRKRDIGLEYIANMKNSTSKKIFIATSFYPSLSKQRSLIKFNFSNIQELNIFCKSQITP